MMTWWAGDMVVASLRIGGRVEEKWKPSFDKVPHVAIYNSFPEVGGIVHTHFRWVISFAQVGRGIPPSGTTYGNYFYVIKFPARENDTRGNYWNL